MKKRAIPMLKIAGVAAVLAGISNVLDAHEVARGITSTFDFFAGVIVANFSRWISANAD